MSALTIKKPGLNKWALANSPRPAKDPAPAGDSARKSAAKAASVHPLPTPVASAPQAFNPRSRTRGRPPSIDWDKLLEVAREVFLERGIRATTLEVAERAGVSEGAIFHRFKSKDALFHKAMHFDANKVPERLALVLEGLDELEIREALLKMASTMMDIGREVMPLMMMTWSNPDHFGCTASDGLRAGFHALLRRFAAYFERRMDAGDLRRMDGEVLARTFIGAIHHYRLTQLTVTSGHDAMPEGMFIRSLVDLLLAGAGPAPDPRVRDPLVRR